MSLRSIEVSPEDRSKIHKICVEYLSGVWSDSHENDLIIKRFNQGYVNQIFYTQLSRDGKEVEECEAVVVKFSMENEFFLYNPFNAIVNNLVASEKKLSPEVLGVFSGGIIHKYIKSRTYLQSDDYNDSTVRLLARKLAKFHSIESPIPKDGSERWVRILFNSFIDADKDFLDSTLNGKVYDIIKSGKFKNLMNIEVWDEMKWLKSKILTTKTQIVFSHCDFNRGNILVEENDQNIDMYFVDLDYSCNTFRGIDIGRYFSSWRHIDPNFGSDTYPTDDEMSVFLDSYIDESINLLGNSYTECESNSKQSLIKEAKLFSLFSICIDVVFCYWMSYRAEKNSEEFMLKGDTRASLYISLKNKFLTEKSLDD